MEHNKDKKSNRDFSVITSLYTAQKILTDKKASDFILDFYMNGQKFQSMHDALLTYHANPIFSIALNQRANLIRIASVILYGFQKGNEWVLEKIQPALFSQKLREDTEDFIYNTVFSKKREKSICKKKEIYEWAYIYLNADKLFEPDTVPIFQNHAIKYYLKLIDHDFWEIPSTIKAEKVFENIPIPKKAKKIMVGYRDVMENLKNKFSFNVGKQLYVSPFDLWSYILSQTGINPVLFLEDSDICKSDITDVMNGICFALRKLPDKSSSETDKTVLSPLASQNVQFSEKTKNEVSPRTFSFLGEEFLFGERENFSFIPKENDKAEIIEMYVVALFAKVLIKKYRADVIAMVKQELACDNKNKKTVTGEICRVDIVAWEEEKRKLLEKIAILEKEKSEQWEQLRSAKNREAAIQTRYDQLYQEKIDLERDNKELQSLIPIDSIEMEIDDAEELSKDILDVDYYSYLTGFFKKKRVVIIGGHNNIISKFVSEFPDVIPIPLERIASCDAAIKSADIILCKCDYINHSFYSKVKGIANRANIPLGYIDKSASVDYMSKSVYMAIQKILNDTK